MDEIYIGKAYVGQILNISFKKTYKNIPIVIVGQERYVSSALGSTRIKIFNVTRTGFSLVVLETTVDYSPSFPYIVI